MPWGGSYPSTEMQSVYSKVPANRAEALLNGLDSFSDFQAFWRLLLLLVVVVVVVVALLLLLLLLRNWDIFNINQLIAKLMYLSFIDVEYFNNRWFFFNRNYDLNEFYESFPCFDCSFFFSYVSFQLEMPNSLLKPTKTVVVLPHNTYTYACRIITTTQ